MYGHRPRYTADRDAAETALKNARLLLPQQCGQYDPIQYQVATLMWINRKKSIGVRSGDLGGQAIGTPRPILRSL